MTIKDRLRSTPGTLGADAARELELQEERIERLERALAKARNDALEEARLAYESHIHTATRDDTDTCVLCGGNVRNAVHLRDHETKKSRVRALKEKKP